MEFSNDNNPEVLPELTADLQPHAARVHQLIADEIKAQGGQIPFWRYMELALYAPGLGYYTAGMRKFGKEGDFVTAPELSPLFSRCLARQCIEVLQHTGGGNILEFGAGSGVMALDILLEMDRLGSLPEHYYIIELSPDLQQRQQKLIADKAAHLLDRVHWLSALPGKGFKGVVLANELLDAMPVDRFLWDDEQLQVACVGEEGGRFVWRYQPADEGFLQIIEELRDGLVEDFPETYASEINLSVAPWVNAVAGILQQGVVLLIDYGCSANEYYHPQRTDGTLMCHYRHRAHSDPLILSGVQDITAWVDFSVVAEAGVTAGLELAGYNTQAMYLLASGLEEQLADVDPSDAATFLPLAQQVKQLTMPGEMGERFKVMALSRDYDQQLSGFRLQDLQDRL